MELGFIILTQTPKKCPKSGNMLVLSPKRSAGKVIPSIFWARDEVIFTDRKIDYQRIFLFLVNKISVQNWGNVS
jgi:hypothetical protein